MRLVEHLKVLGDMWAEANDRSLARLGTIVMNRGHFFDKIDEGGDCGTQAFEKFLTFFRDPNSWRYGTIPPAVAEKLGQFANIGTDAAASTGNADEISGQAVSA